MGKITILDGGLGRELTRFGAEVKQPHWSAEALMTKPDAVKRTHQAFFEAGASIATTANYAVIPFHIGQELFDTRGAELAALSGKLAREAANDANTKSAGSKTAQGKEVKVAGCLPPACGSYLPERFEPEAARHILSILVKSLEPYVDIWLAETMSSLEEMRITAQAVAQSDKPLWISCSLRDEGHPPNPQLRSGESVKEASELAATLGANALLFNCSLPEVMEDAILTARKSLAQSNSSIPLGVYANGFAPKPREGAANESLAQIREELDAPSYLKWAEIWVKAGASLIGGCCGIGTEHIQHLYQWHERLTRSSS
ncbi:MAG: homocysteine S-methyltransferase family protein [Cohaesibacter sp.]|nr:homocysteine S-methyltransferase family protein [Cohaesibacter sp.]MCV6601543.1 homocysteine S-methyltransferase family protein [Cohaesibacter sp.]